MYSESYDYKKNDRLLNPFNTKNESFSWLKKLYIDQHINLLSKNHIDVIGNLLVGFNSELERPIVVVSPVYIEEDLDSLRQTIDNIKSQNFDFVSIFYINGYKPKHTKKYFDDRVSKINDLFGWDSRFIIIKNLYSKKNNIWSIVADMYDSVLMSLKSDSILVRIDSDLKEIPKDYFQDLNNMFKDNSISYVNSKLYYTKINDGFVRLSELISDLWWYRNSKDPVNVPTYGPWMSVRASDLLKVKWIERGMERMEDYVVARKIVQYYWSLESPDYSRWRWYDKIVYCSPRRQIQNLLEWRYFHENTYEFNFVDERSLNETRLNHYNSIVRKIINNSYVPLDWLNIIEDYINWFSLNRKNISKVFFDYRNNNILEKSLYEVKIKNELIYFDEKNFIDAI